jgi:hypothetical protein
VKISFQNYRSLHPKTQEEEAEDEKEEEIWEEDEKDGKLNICNNFCHFKYMDIYNLVTSFS